MSYARRGWGGSDLYIYLDTNGFLHCQVCPLGGSFRAYTTNDMVAHVEEHIAAGHKTEPDLIDALIADRPANDAWLAKENAS